jgi:enoyl-CoA hydratase/carnithine racemase
MSMSMTYRSIGYEATGRIARITLNRPDRLNAIDGTLPGDLLPG